MHMNEWAILGDHSVLLLYRPTLIMTALMVCMWKLKGLEFVFAKFPLGTFSSAVFFIYQGIGSSLWFILRLRFEKAHPTSFPKYPVVQQAITAKSVRQNFCRYPFPSAAVQHVSLRRRVPSVLSLVRPLNYRQGCQYRCCTLRTR